MSMTKNNYIRDGEMTFLTITSDRFGVLSFIIDSEDVERVQEHKWCVQRCGGDSKYPSVQKYYAKATDGRNILLHRFIINAQKGSVVNHINGNTFDMRKKNLEEVGYSENNRKIMRRNNKSGVAGVTYNEKTGRWHSYISKNGKQRSLGYFNNKVDAVNARIQAEIEYGY